MGRIGGSYLLAGSLIEQNRSRGTIPDHTTERLGRRAADEGDNLKNAVEKHGDENKSDATAALRTEGSGRNCRAANEKAVLVYMAWRLGSQNRPRRTMYGRLTTDEDKEVKKAVEKHGRQDWDAVAALVTN
jgi:hypothetical protein